MNNCEGIFGWLFGHKFKSMIVKYSPPAISGKIEGDVKGMLKASAKKEYKIVCKRCGRGK